MWRGCFLLQAVALLSCGPVSGTLEPATLAENAGEMLQLLSERARSVLANIPAVGADAPRPDLPQDCATWADSRPAGSQQLPLLMPASIMSWPEGRRMQRTLAALVEGGRLRRGALLLARLAALRAEHAGGSEAAAVAGAVEAELAAGLAACAVPPSAFAGHQQLLWLLDAQDEDGAARLAKHLPDAMHEMFFTWHTVCPPPLPSRR